MYGENTNTIAIPIYRVLPYPVILQLYVAPFFTLFCSVYSVVLYACAFVSIYMYMWLSFCEIFVHFQHNMQLVVLNPLQV